MEDLVPKRVMTIPTERLELICMDLAFLRATLAGDPRGANPPFTLPESWPGEDVDAVALRLEQLEADPGFQPWSLRAIVLRETGLMIGHIGFHTAPNPAYLLPFSPGAVEFGFTIYPEHRRRGYAFEASRGLMQWAHDTHRITKFVLSIRPDNAPSQGLAARLGFVRIGSHTDEIDGEEDVLELRYAGAHAG